MTFVLSFIHILEPHHPVVPGVMIFIALLGILVSMTTGLTWKDLIRPSGATYAGRSSQSRGNAAVGYHGIPAASMGSQGSQWTHLTKNRQLQKSDLPRLVKQEAGWTREGPAGFRMQAFSI